MIKIDEIFKELNFQHESIQFIIEKDNKNIKSFIAYFNNK